MLEADRLVDLTQPLGPQTLLWPDSTPFVAVVGGTHERDCAYWRSLSLPEHAGTHLDAPAHFAPGGLTADRLPLESLVRPAVVLDVADACGGDPDYALAAGAVARLVARDGIVPRGSAVLVRTGWDALLDDPERYAGPPGALAFPGLAVDAAALLVSRGAVGIGIDTLGVDPGSSTDFAVHRLTQSAGLWHLEGLVDLGRLPRRGAWLVVGLPPVVGGSGAPVRAFAILP